LSRFHADCDGHVASAGRRRLKFVLANRWRGKIGSSAADPIAFKNALLFINPFSRKLYRTCSTHISCCAFSFKRELPWRDRG
jgi:hypothetical protein